MTQLSEEQIGVATVILERFEKQRLPRALDIKARVEAGGKLSATDLDFLAEVMNDAGAIHHLVEQRPDLQLLYTRSVALYRDITTKALENEEKG